MIQEERQEEIERILERAAREKNMDFEALEFFVRGAVLALGAGVLEKVIEGVGAGRRGEPVLCSCGLWMESKGLSSKRIQSVLGGVDFRRSLYRCPGCGNSRLPGDEGLDVVGTRFSPGLRRMMARAGSRAPFAEAAEDLRLYGGLSVDAKDVERVAEEVGRQIEKWMQRKGAQAKLCASAGVAPPEADPPAPTLYVSFDGTGVPMHRQEVASRKGKQPDGSAKTREVKLGCVFTQIARDEEGRPVRDPDSTTYTGAIEDSSDFGHRIHHEALRRGLAQAGRVVVLTDGAPYNKTIVAEHFPDATHVIDLYHARERLYALMKTLLGEEPDETTQEQWLDLLNAGLIENLLEAIRSQLPRSGKRRKQALKAIGYFQENAPMMRYEAFRRQGFFVGSGVVEAGCRSLIARRLKQSGMFWSVVGANAIIASRCCQYSGRFEQFWEDRAA